jgi:uncharacterized protein
MLRKALSLLVLSSSLLWQACDQGSHPVLVLDQHGRERARIERIDGSKNGSISYFWPNTSVRCTGQYRSDIRIGWWHRYHENGTLASLQHFTNGVKDGNQCYWDANGQLVRSEHFALGVVDGHVIRFFPDGELEQLSTFVQGKQEGEHFHCFRSADEFNTVLTGSYLHNEQHGHWRERRADGHLNWEADYHRGRVLRRWEDGKKMPTVAPSPDS